MNTSHRRRVLVCDGHLLVAEALQCLLGPEFDPAGVVGDGLALIEAARTLRPDVVVADVTLPILDGIEALARLRQSGDDVPVVFLTMVAEAAVARRALAAGASGFVLKQSPAGELVSAIHAALEGRIYVTPRLAGQMLGPRIRGRRARRNPNVSLTPRQRDVLRLLAEGCSTKQIATSLSIKVRTVHFHKYEMMEALRLRSGAALIQFAVRQGLIGLGVEENVPATLTH